jgi:hypothetical protein
VESMKAFPTFNLGSGRASASANERAEPALYVHDSRESHPRPVP